MTVYFQRLQRRHRRLARRARRPPGPMAKAFQSRHPHGLHGRHGFGDNDMASNMPVFLWGDEYPDARGEILSSCGEPYELGIWCSYLSGDVLYLAG